MGKHAKVDWKRARRLYERDGKTFKDIAAHFGCQAHTVAAHAKGEAWINGRQIARETAPRRFQKVLADFVERDAEAVRRNLEKKHQATAEILELALVHIERLKKGHELLVVRGETTVTEDPLLALRRLALTVQTVEITDRSIAGLKDDGWRSSGGGSRADSSPDEAAVRAALAELEGDEPNGSRESPEGPLPH